MSKSEKYRPNTVKLPPIAEDPEDEIKLKRTENSLYLHNIRKPNTTVKSLEVEQIQPKSCTPCIIL